MDFYNSLTSNLSEILRNLPNLPEKMRMDLTDGNDARPLLNASRICFDVALPRVEPLSFDGRPTAYLKFIRQFKIYLAERRFGGDQHLLYLIHYFKRCVKEAIEACVLLPTGAGYEKACGILKLLDCCQMEFYRTSKLVD